MHDEKQARLEQIYGAVLRLLARDGNIHTITVSQIAVEAGIGKGTVYEYCTSKEELVRRAVHFSAEREFKTLGDAIRRVESFAAQFDILLDFIERNVADGIATKAILSGNMADMACRMEDVSRLRGQAEMLVEHLAKTGLGEGRLHGSLAFCRFALFSSLAGFAAYVGNLPAGADVAGLKAASRQLVWSSLG